MDTEELYIKVAKSDIVLLISLFEGYGHLVSIRTIDPLCGKILLQVTPGSQDEVKRILEALREDIQWEWWSQHS